MTIPTLTILNDGTTLQRTLTTAELEYCLPIIEYSQDKTILFFASTEEHLKDCIVAIRTDNQVQDNILKLEHWNYHPGRKEIQHTHTTQVESPEHGIKILPLLAQQDAIETFKSLSRLYLS